MYCVYLDPVSGVITRNATVFLDYEMVQNYTLNVSAEDLGDPSNVATALVFIQVLVCMQQFRGHLK